MLRAARGDDGKENEMINQRLCMPKWLGQYLKGKEHHFATSEETIVGVSGGRTSALLWFLMNWFHDAEDAPLVGSFQNTGWEHAGTYEFMRLLTDACQRQVNWLEFRKPPGYGDAPSLAASAIVENAMQAAVAELRGAAETLELAAGDFDYLGLPRSAAECALRAKHCRETADALDREVKRLMGEER